VSTIGPGAELEEHGQVSVRMKATSAVARALADVIPRGRHNAPGHEHGASDGRNRPEHRPERVRPKHKPKDGAGEDKAAGEDGRPCEPMHGEPGVHGHEHEAKAVVHLQANSAPTRSRHVGKTYRVAAARLERLLALRGDVGARLQPVRAERPSGHAHED
jgi:hypothetical protein